MAEEARQSSVLQHREDPGMISSGICSGKVSQKDTWVLRCTRDVNQSGGLNLKDVIRHLPREMHLCEGWMLCIVYQWRPRQTAEVRSLKSQLHHVNGRSASGERIILPRSSVSELLRIKDSPTFSNMIRNNTSLQYGMKSTKEELRTKATGTSVNTVKNSDRSQLFAKRSSKSAWSIVQLMSRRVCWTNR